MHPAFCVLFICCISASEIIQRSESPHAKADANVMQLDRSFKARRKLRSLKNSSNAKEFPHAKADGETKWMQVICREQL